MEPKLPEVGDLKGDEPEVGHTFAKKVGDTHVACEDCGYKILYADNAEFGNLIRDHECPIVHPEDEVNG